MPAAIPKHEPEVRRAKGRAYAARCNEIANNYDSKTIYQALELSERARLRELERQNRELEMENAFLKKAAAYFAREPR